MRAGPRVLLSMLLGLAALAGVSAAPQRVEVGIYLEDADEIDLQDNTFALDLLLWMKWRGEGDPTESLRIVNAIDLWGLTVRPETPAPVVLPDGSSYRRLAVEGRFRGKLSVDRFPLDRHRIGIELFDASLRRDRRIFVPDPASRVRADLAIPGWTIGRLSTREAGYDLGTDLGEGHRTGDTSRSRIAFELEVARPRRFFLLKMVPPTVLVMAACWMLFFLAPAFVDARVSSVVGALMSMVFLQLAFSDPLPDTGSLTLLDKLFDLSYLVLVAMLAAMIRSTAAVTRLEALDALPEDAAAKDEAARIRAHLAAFESRCRIGFPLAYLAGLALLVMAGSP